MEMHAHGGLGEAQDGGDLPRGEPFPAGQENGRAKLGREVLHRTPDVAQAALRVQGVARIGGGGGQALDEVALIVPSGVRVTPRQELPPSARLAAMVEAHVGDDAIEPRRELRLAGEGTGPFVKTQERLLRAVLGRLMVAEDAPRDPESSLLESLHETVEGSRFPPGNPTA